MASEAVQTNQHYLMASHSGGNLRILAGSICFSRLPKADVSIVDETSTDEEALNGRLPRPFTPSSLTIGI